MLKAARFNRRQHGLSLVELLVGIAVGLVVVAGASLMVAGQLADNRRLLVEAQLQQDLRAAMDVMTRELRRAGAQLEDNATMAVWTEVAPTAMPNEYAAMLSPTTGTVSSITYAYQSIAGTTARSQGFVLSSGVIYAQRTDGGSQELTDNVSMTVDSLSITPRVLENLRVPCPQVCTGGGTDCWPKIQVRTVDIAITAHAKRFPEVQRSLVSSVRLRNDYQVMGAATQVCPT